MKELVTVYIPTFNRVELLERAVNSVLRQTYENIEVIIVDDASTDDTHNYLELISRKDNRVKYFIKQERSGACISRNIAIQNATGKYITGLDDDDYFLDTRIEDFVRQWEKIDINKTAFLYGLFLTKETNGIKYPNKLKSKLIKKVIYADDLKIANYPGNQIFTETVTLRSVNGFDSKMPAWQDLDTWYRILSTTGKNAKRIDNINYVYDVSHEHERISKKERHVKARYIFLQKNNLHKLIDSPFYLVNYKDENVKTFIKRWF
ncbi:TPA: glycosyltransferase, partial [Klebsiella pneumoniae]|nr:glycosyltransferase [Klebsiella pneumoniae subsp. pneumoniae]HDG8456857.1 glycosyltransferase [Klebsiella pneumoniae]HDG9083112.1 glycosyltransferase [Klebsiella pneumoniae]